MNNKQKIGLVFGIIAFMVLLVWLFSGRKSGDRTNHRKPFVSANWEREYRLDDKSPLGLYLFTALTKAHVDTHQLHIVRNAVMLDSITEDQESRKTFLFVGKNFGISDREMDSIMNDVERGSILFLSFDDLTENLYPRLFQGISFGQEYAQEIEVKMKNKKYSMVHLFQNDTLASEWWAFDELVFEEEFIGLSSFMGMTNFVRVPHGEGSILLHSTPKLFFNYQMKRRPGFQYASQVLNELPTNNPIYLLELGRLSDHYGDNDEFLAEEDGEAGGNQEDSYLQLIFQNRSLLTATLLSVLGMLLFAVFRSKRMRPVVAFIPKKKDMTLAFAETITSIYLSRRNAYGLLQVQRKNFYDTIQRFFFVDLQHREGERSIRILAEKSNRPVQEITDLIDALETKKASQVDEQYVSNVAKDKHTFYRNTGIISDGLNNMIQSQELVFRRSLWIPMLILLFGLTFVFVGMYFLVGGFGIGIVGWPVGIFFLIQGFLRLSRPYFIVNENAIIHFNALAQKKEYRRTDLLKTEVRSTGVLFHFKNNQKRMIYDWELSRFDRAQFERLISKIDTLEL